MTYHTKRPSRIWPTFPAFTLHGLHLFPHRNHLSLVTSDYMSPQVSPRDRVIGKHPREGKRRRLEVLGIYMVEQCIEQFGR